MKHTLKSLLFTTVLTLPTVFGAACADDKASPTPPTTAAADIRTAADELKPLGDKYYEQAVTFFKQATGHKVETLSHISSAAAGLKDLGSEYYDRTPQSAMRHELYETSVNSLTKRHARVAEEVLINLGPEFKSAATPSDIRNAAYQLTRLGPAYYGRVADLFELSANHPKATPDDITRAVSGLISLGSPYSDGAEALMRQDRSSE